MERVTKKLIKTLNSKGVTLYDVIEKAVYEWIKSPFLSVSVYYDYDNDEIFASSNSRDEILNSRKKIFQIFEIEPDWMDTWGFNVEDLFTGTEKETRVKQLRSSGLDNLEILMKIYDNSITDIVTDLTHWIIDQYSSDGITNWKEYFKSEQVHWDVYKSYVPLHYLQY